MNDATIAGIGLIICILVAAVLNTAWKHRPGQKPPPEPTLAEELKAGIEVCVRERITHEGLAEYNTSQAEYFARRQVRLQAELDNLVDVVTPPKVAVSVLPDGFLKDNVTQTNNVALVGAMKERLS